MGNEHVPVQKGKRGRRAVKNMAGKVRKNIGSIASPEECSKGEKKIVYFFLYEETFKD